MTGGAGSKDAQRPLIISVIPLPVALSDSASFRTGRLLDAGRSRMDCSSLCVATSPRFLHTNFTVRTYVCMHVQYCIILGSLTYHTIRQAAGGRYIPVTSAFKFMYAFEHFAGFELQLSAN